MNRSPWLGYSIAPFTAPLLYGIIILFFPTIYDNKEFSAETWLLSEAMFILASYVACLLIGAPLIFALRKYQKLTFIWLVITGSCCYALTINSILFAVMEPTILGNIYVIILETTLTGLAMGMLIVVVFSSLAGIPWRSS